MVNSIMPLRILTCILAIGCVVDALPAINDIASTEALSISTSNSLIPRAPKIGMAKKSGTRTWTASKAAGLAGKAETVKVARDGYDEMSTNTKDRFKKDANKNFEYTVLVACLFI